MLHFKDIAEKALDSEEAMLLSDYPIEDTISYYWSDIEKMIQESIIDELWTMDNPVYSYDRKFSQLEAEAIQEYLIDNAADLLTVHSGIFIIPNYFSLVSISEIEINLQDYHFTPYRKSVINDNTDMYIPEWTNLGYVTTDMHLDILIDVNAIESMLSDKVIENIEYMENRFDTDILNCKEYQQNRKEYL